jgi:hypothetical protein
MCYIRTALWPNMVAMTRHQIRHVTVLSKKQGILHFILSLPKFARFTLNWNLKVDSVLVLRFEKLLYFSVIWNHSTGWECSTSMRSEGIIVSYFILIENWCKPTAEKRFCRSDTRLLHAKDIVCGGRLNQSMTCKTKIALSGGQQQVCGFPATGAGDDLVCGGLDVFYRTYSYLHSLLWCLTGQLVTKSNQIDLSLQ